MTKREMYEGTDMLIARRDLSENETRDRLLKYYNRVEVNDIIFSAKAVDVWTDSEKQTSVVYLRHNNTFIIIATGKRFDLVSQEFKNNNNSFVEQMNFEGLLRGV